MSSCQIWAERRQARHGGSKDWGLRAAKTDRLNLLKFLNSEGVLNGIRLDLAHDWWH